MADKPTRRSVVDPEKGERAGPKRAQAVERGKARSSPRSTRPRPRRPDDGADSANEQRTETRLGKPDRDSGNDWNEDSERVDDSAEPGDDETDSDNDRGTRAAQRGSGRERRGLGVLELIAQTRGQLQAVTGRPVTSVLGFERTDSGFQLTVEVLELERIPETTSILGCYRVIVDQNGELLEYRRLRRYNRSQPDEDY